MWLLYTSIRPFAISFICQMIKKSTASNTFIGSLISITLTSASFLFTGSTLMSDLESLSISSLISSKLEMLIFTFVYIKLSPFYLSQPEIFLFKKNIFYTFIQFSSYNIHFIIFEWVFSSLFLFVLSSV